MDREDIGGITFCCAIVIGISSSILDILFKLNLSPLTFGCIALEFYLLFHWWRTDKKKRKLRDVLNYFRRWEDESRREQENL